VGRPSRRLTRVVPQARWDAWPYAKCVRRAIVSVVTGRSSGEATVATPARDRLVVGVDASSAAGPTMAWAHAEAAARAVSLRIVSLAVRGPADGTEHDEHIDTLVRHAADADLVVVGATRSGDTAGWLRRCVPAGASRRSTCPLVVVRGEARQPLQRIVVGIDGLSGADAAVDWAADEARLHSAELVVVHAWQRRGGPGASIRSNDLARSDARCVIDLAVRRCNQRSGRRASGESIDGDPSTVLAAASRNADLIVVGSRGSSGFRTMLFGSVTLLLVECAGCPVAVIPPQLRIAGTVPRLENGTPNA
jgi:nucleotide-binding universal stress UspA family protein